MSSQSDLERQIAEQEHQLSVLDAERARLIERLAELKELRAAELKALSSQNKAPVTMSAPTASKIELFRSLFRGRDDVFPKRWENAKTGKSGYSPACGNDWVRGVCGKPTTKCGDCQNRALLPVSNEVIRGHLMGRLGSAPGDFTIGVYPMLLDETCWFLAVDFDKGSWMSDVAAFREAAQSLGVPVAVERSRSGNGAHAWIFFAEPVPAIEARRLGSLLITAAMDRSPDIGFASYDRFFPSQDTLPSGGYGNLIALPLQAKPREKGASVFVDEDFQPYADQWAHLSTMPRMPKSDLLALTTAAAETGRILQVHLPETEDDEPWKAPPSRRRRQEKIEGPLPQTVEVVLGACVYVDRTCLPPALVSRLVRLAAFQNPEFYSKQAMRLSTFGVPRVICCAELFPKHVALPRGCLNDALDQLSELGGSDERERRAPTGRAASNAIPR